MKLFTVVIATVLLLMTGCKERILEPDVTPPTAPRGLATYPGDGYVEIEWLANLEPDLSAYNVYASSTLHGTYELIGTTRTNTFIDNKVYNGDTWYYTVTAVDRAGNESEPSPDILSETPRPEGHNAVMNNYRDLPNTSGYDFSTFSVGPYDDKYTDIFFEEYNGTYYLNVWTDSDIQDLGYTTALYSVEQMPTRGWSPTKDAVLIIGHTYAVRTWDNHFAKVRITGLTPERVTFEWAYQLQEGNTRLKATIADRIALSAGSGTASRK